jgi:hypothetical protein
MSADVIKVTEHNSESDTTKHKYEKEKRGCASGGLRRHVVGVTESKIKINKIKH